MEDFIKENFLKIKNRVKDILKISIKMFIKDNSIMISFLDMEYTNGNKVINIKDIGNRVRNKEMEFLFQNLEIFLKDNCFEINLMVMEYINGLMEINIKVSGNKVLKMVLEKISIIMVIYI